MSALIQFSELDDLAAGLSAGSLVRVTALAITEGAFDAIARQRMAGSGAHVRVSDEQGHIIERRGQPRRAEREATLEPGNAGPKPRVPRPRLLIGQLGMK